MGRASYSALMGGAAKAPSFSIRGLLAVTMVDVEFKTWQCQSCGYIYDEAAGDPVEGLAPGTRWADIPDDWVCPMCGTPKSDFDLVEI